MAGRSSEGGVHTVLAVDGENCVVGGRWDVPTAEVLTLVDTLRRTHASAQILVDGQVMPDQMVAPVSAAPAPVIRTITAPDGDSAANSGVELAHHLLWETYDRAARVQAWMLERANVFTRDLLENNRRLADQASLLQQRFQDALQKVDLMETERKLMENDAMARRLSRHIIAQERAEMAAAQEKDHGWIDDLLEGVAVVLGAPRSKN